MRKATTWILRAAGVLLPLLCAAGTGATDDYCYEAQVRRTVWSAPFEKETDTSCLYTCTVTSQTAWTCWVPDPPDREPLPYRASRAPRAPSSAAAPGAVPCSWRIVNNGDATETYTVSREKPKGDGAQGFECEKSAPELCCEGWSGVCDTSPAY